MSGNKFPASFRLGSSLLEALKTRCKELGGVSCNFYVYALLKSHLKGAELKDDDIVQLWNNRTTKLDDNPI